MDTHSGKESNLDLENTSRVVRSIAYGSKEYQQACQLRYELFFAPHNLPTDIVKDSEERNCFHGGIVVEGKTIAYGHLLPQSGSIYQIKQMVVEPAYQKQGLGKQILMYLIDFARQRGAKEIRLHSRLTAVGFYQKLGFQTYGDRFPSDTTGVMHIAMRLELSE